MKGTEKQIKWAEDIKSGMLAEIEHFKDHGDDLKIFEETFLCRVYGRAAYEDRMAEAVSMIPTRDAEGNRIKGNFNKKLAAKAEARKAMIAEAKARIETEESATWFIDRR